MAAGNAGGDGGRPLDRGPRRDRVAAVKRRFQVEMTFEIEVDDALLKSVDTAEWRDTFYHLTTAEEIAAHIAYNLIRGNGLTSLEGFADQPVSAAVITSAGAIDVSAQEIE